MNSEPVVGSEPAPNLDPVTFSVMLNRLGSIASEMTIALENAAMSSILGLCRDYSCCVYDAQLRQVAVVDAIPIHTNSMDLLLREIVEAFGDDIAEGDVIACNYAYCGNSHIGDLVTACPVFHDGELVFWAASKGHQLDVGGPVPASSNAFAENIWQEGFQIPPTKLYEAGKRRDDVIRLYLTNMRFREALEGDLMAMLGSIWTAERRLRELCEEFGVIEVKGLVEDAIAYASERTRAAIREIPNGRYEAEGWLDADGAGQTDIVVKCCVTVHDESVEVDFTGSAPQVKTGLNASFAVMQAAGGIPLVMSLDPDIPHNEGCLQCVTVSAPAGSICNATYPAATTYATTIPADLMQDVVCKALVQAIPERMRAGSAHWSNVPFMSGITDEGEPWGHLLLNAGSGGAAAAGVDGWPLLTCNAAHGGLKTASVEHTELLFPLEFESWEIEPDSMGLGQNIGGPGVRCTVRPIGGPFTFMLANDGLRNPPFGAAGGSPGRGGGQYLGGPEPRRRFLPPVAYGEVGESESWTGVSTGGGGYGDPLDRPVDMIRDDVRDGLYSRAVARRVFGVVISQAPEWAIDESATAAARSAMKQAGDRPAVLPLRPAASTWIEDNLRDNDVYIERCVDGVRPS